MERVSSDERLSVAGYLRLVGIAALIGIPAALLAALFLALVHELQHLLWHGLPAALGYVSPPWFLVVGLPVVGALIVIFARRVLPGDGGHEPLAGLQSAPTPITHGPGVVLAAIGTLAFGAVLGPEGPVIALGSILGMVAIRFLPVRPRGAAVVSSAGSFSAISALFGGPLVAGILLVEGGVGLGARLLPTLLPGLVSAGIGYLIFGAFGNWGGLNAPGLVVPGLPAYTGVHLEDLLVAVGVGVVAALVVTASRLAAGRIRGVGSRLGLAGSLVLGALAIGLLAELAELLGADSQDVLFSGQASVPVVITAGSTKLVVILIVAKFVCYAISLGCGFRGGPIFPAIFLGVALASLPVVWFGMSPTLAVAVGAAAGMAAQTRLLISPLLLAALLVGTQGLAAAPVAVLAACASWLTATGIQRRFQAGQEDAQDPSVHPQ